MSWANLNNASTSLDTRKVFFFVLNSIDFAYIKMGNQGYNTYSLILIM